jgi:hypothetical protein
VLNSDVRLAADLDVGVLLLRVGEEVEGENYGTVGGVLEGDDAAGCGARLDGGEDVFDGGDGREGVGRGGEGVESSLWGVVSMSTA